MKKLITILCMAFALMGNVQGQTTLIYSQDWSNTSLLSTNDDWSSVTSVIGFLGQDLVANTGANPSTILGVSSTASDIDLVANQTSPNTLTSGGVAEFEITNPVLALQGSGTADAPYLQISFSTIDRTNIFITYNVRDIDGSTDNSIQPLALQYRVGNTGQFTNIDAAYIADASTGPSLATFSTIVGITLPALVENSSLVQIRFVTANAVGSDEWIGIDDISITGVAGSIVASSAKSITGFTLAGIAGIINSNTINVTVPFGTNLNGIYPSGRVSPNATVNPSFDVSRDFSSALTYTVTAEDLSTAMYSVSVTSLPGSSQSSVLDFKIEGVSAVISNNMINVTVPSSADLSNVVAIGIVSDFASVTPPIATLTNFLSSVVFTVTAQNLTSFAVYTVTAVKSTILSSANSITGFVLGGFPATIAGNNIYVSVPYATDVTNLTATGSGSPGASVAPNVFTGIDYTNPVVLTVTAENLDVNFYTVYVVKRAASAEKAITAFYLQGPFVSTITGNTIEVKVPFGTSLANLTAAGVISPLATINPAFSTSLDYSTIKTFTITAQNLSTAIYNVTVTVLPQPTIPSVIETFTIHPTLTGWSIYTPKSLSNWNWSVTNGSINANGFGSVGANPMESWLITPKLSFTGSSQAVGFKGVFGFSDSGTPKPARILYSLNYSGTGPVSVAGWTVIADDYKGVVTVPGLKGFNTTGTGYIAFQYITSSAGAISWTVDDVTINGANLFTPTITGFVYNWELNNPPSVTLSGITPLGFVRNSINPATGLTTIPGSLTFTIAGQLLGKNIAANVGLSGGAQFSIVDETGANTMRIPSALYSTLSAVLVEGNSVTVAGILGQNAGLSQFVVNKVIGIDYSVKPRPLPRDVVGITEAVESSLIRVIAQVDSTSWNPAPSGNGFNCNSTINGVVYVVRVYAAVNDLFGKSFTKLFGRDNKVATLTIVGLGGQFSTIPPLSTGYQIVPYSVADIQFPTPKSGENNVVSFQYLPQTGLSVTGTGTISGNSISITVPFGTNVNSLVPTIQVSPKATVNPNSGTVPTYLFVDPQYFANYSVVAENGISRGYQLVVSVAEKESTTVGGGNTTLSGANAILSFVYYPQTALGLNMTIAGIISGNNISVSLPIEVTVTGLVPTITVSPKATLSTVSETVYKVTSESGNAALYTLNITYIASGISNFEALNAFELYPNPTSSSFNIAAKAGLGFEIFNTLGVKVFETNTTDDVTSVEALIVKGIYLVKVKGSSISKRIVIE